MSTTAAAMASLVSSRGRLADKQANLTKAQSVEAQCRSRAEADTAVVERRKASDAEADRVLGARIHQLAAAGSVAAELPEVESHEVAAQRTAEARQARASAHALALAVADEQAAQTELLAAQREVAAAERAVDAADVAELCEAVLLARRSLDDAGIRLRQRLPDGVHLSTTVVLPPLAERALAALPPLDDLNTRVSLLTRKA